MMPGKLLFLSNASPWAFGQAEDVAFSDTSNKS